MSQGQQNYMKNDIMNMNWANIQSEYNFTYKETDTNKRFLLWGALMHITSDTYAHRSWTKNSSGNWVHIGSSDTDDTGKIPLRYDAAKKVLEKLGYTPEDITGGKLSGISKQIKNYKKLAEELGVGEPTLRDIVKELEKPARDPRDEMPKPVLRTDVLDMKDLKEGMILKGTVRNVIDFGAFVDIGVHQDGLVHISEMSERYIKHPLEAVSVGDVVDVRVLGVDMKKKRISLSMKGIK